MCRRNTARRRRHIFYFCKALFDCRVCGRGSMMKRMSFSETIFLFFLALVIFGPKKLPEIARQVGKWMNEFRRASNEFKSQIEQEIAHLEVESKQTILPPSPPVEGTASRTLNPVDVESIPAPATLAASNDEPSSAARDNGAEPGATEAVPPTETVASSSSQESHG
jgi:sec-independent protein translocase protein TatB